MAHPEPPPPSSSRSDNASPLFTEAPIRAITSEARPSWACGAHGGLHLVDRQIRSAECLRGLGGVGKMRLQPSPAAPAAEGADLLSLGSPLQKPPGLSVRAGLTTPALLFCPYPPKCLEGGILGSSDGESWIISRNARPGLCRRTSAGHEVYVYLLRFSSSSSLLFFSYKTKNTNSKFSTVSSECSSGSTIYVGREPNQPRIPSS